MLTKLMDKACLNELMTCLREHGVVFASGLTDGEVADVEAYYTFRFPPDLKMLLQCALPISEGFVNWRDYANDAVAYRVEEPFLGLLHAVEHGFWLRSWGAWPYDPSDALAIARSRLQAAPRLIPIYQHRYLPAEPCLSGNPILSVWGSDIICYGNDLAAFIVTQFRLGVQINVPPEPSGRQHSETGRSKTTSAAPRLVRFWDKIIASW